MSTVNPATDDGHTETHTCLYAWCRGDAPNQIEHWAHGELTLGDHAPEVEAINCYAFCTDDGNVYDDEIILTTIGKRANVTASLTIAEARALRDLLDTAIANVTEIRGGAGDQRERAAINERFPNPFLDMDFKDARALAITASQAEEAGAVLTEPLIWRLRYDMYAPYCGTCGEGGGLHIAECDEQGAL